jgi:hypothetical protein
MFNLELLIFHCVVWIGYSFLTDVQLITVDIPLCGVDMVFLLDRCSTYNCWCSIVWCGLRRNTIFTPHNGISTVLSWASVNKEYPIHTTQWNINSSKLNICQEGIPYPHHTMEYQQFLLIFHCVVWIWYSFLTDVQLITVDIPLCGVDRVFFLDRCST